MSLRAGSELPLGRLQSWQTVPDSAHPNACVGGCSVLGPLGFWMKPFCGFSFSAAADLECAPRFLGSRGLSVSLARGSGVCVGDRLSL